MAQENNDIPIMKGSPASRDLRIRLHAVEKSSIDGNPDLDENFREIANELRQKIQAIEAQNNPQKKGSEIFK